MPKILQKNPTFWKTLSIVVLGLVLITQSVALYLSTQQDNHRQMLIVEKPPVRLIVTWDTDEYEQHKELGLEAQKVRGEFVKRIIDLPFQEYKFNDSLNINIHTETIKSDAANINIKESETITDTVTEEKE